jgi:hypothetical protein
MKRKLSDSSSAVRARERRLDAWVKRAEAEWNAEIAALMATGLSFDEAYVAAGGLIIDDPGEREGRAVA